MTEQQMAKEIWYLERWYPMLTDEELLWVHKALRASSTPMIGLAMTEDNSFDDVREGLLQIYSTKDTEIYDKIVAIKVEPVPENVARELKIARKFEDISIAFETRDKNKIISAMQEAEDSGLLAGIMPNPKMKELNLDGRNSLDSILSSRLVDNADKLGAALRALEYIKSGERICKHPMDVMSPYEHIKGIDNEAIRTAVFKEQYLATSTSHAIDVFIILLKYPIEECRAAIIGLGEYALESVLLRGLKFPEVLASEVPTSIQGMQELLRKRGDLLKELAIIVRWIDTYVKKGDGNENE